MPTVAIYGANAAGKSNLFKALTSAILFVRNSSLMQVGSKIAITPFLMDEESKRSKTRFDFVYVYDEVKYEYGFVADVDRVYGMSICTHINLLVRLDFLKELTSISTDILLC